jgi:hypothetical protein
MRVNRLSNAPLPSVRNVDFIIGLEMRTSSAIWHIEASGRTQDWKRNAGASNLIRRSPISPTLSRPPRVECNLEVPTIPAGLQTLYFFPDRLLVYDRTRVGAVAYRDLKVDAGVTRFIESDAVPSDSMLVDRTWRFVNKKGGPDRRFSNNRELPILQYGVLHFTSGSGLNELFNFSASKKHEAFISALAGMAASNDRASVSGS